MIEIRVVTTEPMYRSEIQYRYRNQLPPGCIPPPDWEEWSTWQTAEWIKAEGT